MKSKEEIWLKYPTPANQYVHAAMEEYLQEYIKSTHTDKPVSEVDILNARIEERRLAIYSLESALLDFEPKLPKAYRICMRDEIENHKAFIEGYKYELKKFPKPTPDKPVSEGTEGTEWEERKLTPEARTLLACDGDLNDDYVQVIENYALSEEFMEAQELQYKPTPDKPEAISKEVIPILETNIIRLRKEMLEVKKLNSAREIEVFSLKAELTALKEDNVKIVKSFKRFLKVIGNSNNITRQKEIDKAKSALAKYQPK